MSDQKCMACKNLLGHGDKVRAEIITRFVALKSKIAYALERPSECIYVEHFNCNNPKSVPLKEDKEDDIDPYFPDVTDVTD